MEQLERYEPGQIEALQQHKTVLLHLEQQLKRNILEMGQHLAEVREILRHNKHGGFVQWIEEQLGWAKQTAYNYLNVYERFCNCPNFGRLSLPASALYVLAAESTPDEAREAILQRAEAGEQLTFKEVDEAVKAYRSTHTHIASGSPGLRSGEHAPSPSTYCAFCGEGERHVYTSTRTGVGICLGCAQMAARDLQVKALRDDALTPHAPGAIK